MYEDHWNLKTLPFDHRNDPKFYYPSESHQASLLKLSYAIESRRAVSMLCGDPGTGKSMLVENCVASLPDAIAPVVRIPYPALPAEQLVRYMARQFAPKAAIEPNAPFAQSIEVLDAFLRTNVSQSRHALVIVEEAHLLESHGSLQPLRMLLNIASDQSHAEAAWSLCLVGSISLVSQIARHSDLEDRIAVRCVLDRFNLEATEAYILHRLRAAGHAGKPIFTERALETIQDASLGIPRRINRICDMSLMIGYAQELRQIDAPLVHIAQQELFSRSVAA